MLPQQSTLSISDHTCEHLDIGRLGGCFVVTWVFVLLFIKCHAASRKNMNLNTYAGKILKSLLK